MERKRYTILLQHEDERIEALVQDVRGREVDDAAIRLVRGGPQVWPPRHARQVPANKINIRKTSEGRGGRRGEVRNDIREKEGIL